MMMMMMMKRNMKIISIQDDGYVKFFKVENIQQKMAKLHF
jgi:hypothetical protein